MSSIYSKHLFNQDVQSCIYSRLFDPNDVYQFQRLLALAHADQTCTEEGLDINDSQNQEKISHIRKQCLRAVISAPQFWISRFVQLSSANPEGVQRFQKAGFFQSSGLALRMERLQENIYQTRFQNSFSGAVTLSFPPSVPPSFRASLIGALELGGHPFITLSLGFETPLTIESLEKMGKEPLHRAAIAGDYKTCRDLLFLGGDPQALDAEEKKPLDYVPQENAPLRELFEGTSPSLEDKPYDERNSVIVWERMKRGAPVERALDGSEIVDSRTHQTILHKVSERQDIGYLDFLLGGAIPLSPRDFMGITPLHLAVENGNHRGLMKLLEKGADPHQRDIIGRSPLHWAAYYNDTKAISILLDFGASIDARDLQGQCLCELLKITEGTPLIWNSTMAAVISKPSQISDSSMKMENNFVLAIFKRAHALRPCEDKGYTPLHVAAERGHFEAMDLLLARGSDPHLTSTSFESLKETIELELQELRKIEAEDPLDPSKIYDRYAPLCGKTPLELARAKLSSENILKLEKRAALQTYAKAYKKSLIAVFKAYTF